MHILWNIQNEYILIVRFSFYFHFNCRYSYWYDSCFYGIICMHSIYIYLQNCLNIYYICIKDIIFYLDNKYWLTNLYLSLRMMEIFYDCLYEMYKIVIYYWLWYECGMNVLYEFDYVLLACCFPPQIVLRAGISTIPTRVHVVPVPIYV